MTMDRRIDLLGSLLIALMGIAIVAVAWVTPPPRQRYDIFGPMGVPLLLGAGLAILGALQSYRTFVLLRTMGGFGIAEGTEDDPEHPASGRRAIGFIAGSLLYLLALQPIGYLIMTPIAIVLGLWALRVRTWWVLLAIALGYTLISFVLFSEVLSVPIPVGVLEDLLVDAGLIDPIR